MSGTEKVLAFPVHPGVTPLDLIGPLTVLKTPGIGGARYRTVVVGERAEQLATDTPLGLLPAATFAEVPDPWAVIVPGGGASTLTATEDEALVSYVRSAAVGAEVVGSTGNGALVLAAAGLLRGARAAVHWAYREPLEELGAIAARQRWLVDGRLHTAAGGTATTNWFYSGILERLGATYHQRRWVEDGDLVMSAGVSAGIDMALHLAARLTDEATARRVQRAVDYDPRPPWGGIDYDRIPGLPRAVRGAIGLTAPVAAGRARRLTRAGR
ncbi:DJ-1/PfpI family protein [Geodermatophilus arenarius]|uniref:DJ-1/PfpI family protein n=1 Tax=Geodermatophilus arenarius TaxID=1137990 RepID=A0ABV9LNW8_9ACTN